MADAPVNRLGLLRGGSPDPPRLLPQHVGCVLARTKNVVCSPSPVRAGTHPTHCDLGRLAAVMILAVASLVAAPHAQAAQKFLVPDGSRATAVHRLPMLDDAKQPINPANDLVMPLSPRTTCSGACHNYAEIEGGWHTSATDTAVAPGRPGEPWIYVDLRTGTQIPVSYRPWPGTWRPADVGLTPWKFQIMFGRHSPGFQDTFPEGVKDPAARWILSGNLDINCLACHSSEPGLDMSEWAVNIEKQNLRWAATAASGMALVTGDCRSLPEEYDNMEADNGDDPKRQPMRVQYEQWRFNSKKPKEALFPTVNDAANDRCYFCHTNKPIGRDAPAKWEIDQDVHVRAGMACTTCHRSGNDHKIARGYEGEPFPGGAANLTCRGCHLGEEAPGTAGGSAGQVPDSSQAAGRMGAPVPQHKGLPTIHLEKLTCTACHSGPMPGPEAAHLMTSRAHGLGIKAKEHRDDAPPYIEWPVYVRGDDGRIAPQKVMWPAFWGLAKPPQHHLTSGSFSMYWPASWGLARPPLQDYATVFTMLEVTPLAPEVVAKKAGLKDVPLKEWKPLTADQVIATLKALTPEKPAGGATAKPAEKTEANDTTQADPVYVCGGKVWRLGDDGKLETLDHSAAAPVMWPIGHDVRPASQSLGSGGCTDCHAADSPISFGTVTADGPAKFDGPDGIGPPVVRTMYEFQGRDPQVLRSWALSYQFRPMFKVVGFITAGVIGAVLLLYVLLGLAAFLKCAARKAP